MELIFGRPGLQKYDNVQNQYTALCCWGDRLVTAFYFICLSWYTSKDGFEESDGSQDGQATTPHSLVCRRTFGIAHATRRSVILNKYGNGKTWRTAPLKLSRHLWHTHTQAARGNSQTKTRFVCTYRRRWNDQPVKYAAWRATKQRWSLTQKLPPWLTWQWQLNDVSQLQSANLLSYKLHLFACSNM